MNRTKIENNLLAFSVAMWITSHLGVAIATAILSLYTTADAHRPMENLGRGVVAIRSADDAAFISWRVLGLDPEDIGFNLYRATGDGDAELASRVASGGRREPRAAAGGRGVSGVDARPDGRAGR